MDYLRALAGAALEQRHLDAAEHLTEQALSISERGRPSLEFIVLLDRAEIWAAAASGSNSAAAPMPPMSVRESPQEDDDAH